MRKWSVFCLAVLCGAAFAWQLYSAPALRAEDDARLAAKLPSGFTLTKATPLGTQGMPGVRKIFFYQVEVQPGAKWRNLARPADIWDFCYVLAGEMTLSNGTVIRPSTSFTFAAKTSIPLFSNNGKRIASYICWEFSR